MKSDITIIGGGIVGLATAYAALQKDKNKKVLVLEKENEVALHQSGRNSGVLHTGVYYKPGSEKALHCARGKELMEEFCTKENIPFEICGKLIVAGDESELRALDNLRIRAEANGVEHKLLSPTEMKTIEPHVQGVKALHLPRAGIVDYRAVCKKLAEKIERLGGEIKTGAKVMGSHRNGAFTIETTAGAIETSLVINCAGQYCDRVAGLLGTPSKTKIVPFRGEYFELSHDAEKLCKNLIYPVPDPQFPFLGLHFTRMVGGGVECGPNAVFAFGREAYRKGNFNLGEFLESVSYSGFLSMAKKHWREGVNEMYRSFSKAAFVRALQRLVPEINGDQLTPAPAGIRGQAITPDGKLVDDFLIERSERVINVLNAPSPAATASLAIGKTIISLI